MQPVLDTGKKCREYYASGGLVGKGLKPLDKEYDENMLLIFLLIAH